MKSSIRLIVLNIVLLVFISCSNPAHIEIGESGSIPTLNCILHSNSDSIIAFLTHSRPITSNEPFLPIEKAEVSLYEDGQLIGSFEEIDTGKYLLVYNPVIGKKYCIEAKTNSLFLKSELTMPEHLVWCVEQPDTLKNHFTVKLEMENTKAKSLWIAAYYYQNHSVFGNKTGLAEADRSLYEELYSNNIYIDQFNRRIDAYDGLNFSYGSYIHLIFPPDPPSLFSLDIGLKSSFKSGLIAFTCSEDYAAYIKSAMLAIHSDMFIEELPLNSPNVRIHSNIEGGTGIFGAITYSYPHN